MSWTKEKVASAIEDCKNSPFGASAILHVQLDLRFIHRSIESLYRQIFRDCGVTSDAIELCGLLAKEKIRQNLNTRYEIQDFFRIYNDTGLAVIKP